MSDNTSDFLGVNPSRLPSGSSVGDFLAFRTMITPVLIQIIFWIGVVGCIVTGAALIATAGDSRDEGLQIVMGLGWILLGPLSVRIWCEFLIVFFRVNQTLTEIKNKLK